MNDLSIEALAILGLVLGGGVILAGIVVEIVNYFQCRRSMARRVR